jgi:hypothetical protein
LNLKSELGPYVAKKRKIQGVIHKIQGRRVYTLISVMFFLQNCKPKGYPSIPAIGLEINGIESIWEGKGETDQPATMPTAAVCGGAIDVAHRST